MASDDSGSWPILNDHQEKCHSAVMSDSGLFSSRCFQDSSVHFIERKMESKDLL